MSTLLKKMRSQFVLSLIILFLLPVSLKAADTQILFNSSNESSIINNEIEERIRSYLSTDPCCPVLTTDAIEYDIKVILEEAGVVYTIGDLSQNENCLFAVFSIERGWFSTSTSMLYMTTDVPPTPLLFNDICSAAKNFLPKSLSNYHVFIQKFEDPKIPKDCYMQTWSFYNTQEWIELLVVLVPTLDGGTDFAVMVLK